MQEKIDKAGHLPRKKKRRRSLLPLLLLICCVSGTAVIGYRYLQQMPVEEVLATHENAPDTGKVLPVVPLKDGSQQQYSLSPNLPDSQNGSTAISPEDNSAPPIHTDSLLPQMEDQPVDTALGTKSQPILPESSLKTPVEARAAIDSFYAHLDQQPYLRSFHFDAPSKTYFSRLIQKMLDTPPVVSGETNDLFTVLQNTAHFFRVVGRQNMLALKAIISHEQKSYEEVLADFYNISQQPAYLRESYSINLEEDALYDYAGFFLTTMGGRLYLFRRDSSLRMIVSYYSILVVDEAIRSGRNRHGIDLPPVIDNLISEIENSGNQLQLKEHYLDNLYDLKEKYL